MKETKRGGKMVGAASAGATGRIYYLTDANANVTAVTDPADAVLGRYACLDCAERVQHIRRHNRAMLGKRIGQRAGEFQPGEVVTICDHLLRLSLGQPKAEIAREPLWIPLDRLV
jgi:hypothetical protein